MNTAAIIKFEYRLLESPDFSELVFTSFTGTIKKSTAKGDPGKLHTTNINLKVSEVTGEKTLLFDSLLYSKAQYRITDSNGRIHLVGDDNYPARLEYEAAIDGNPGGWNGYSILINHLSPYSYLVS